MESVIDHGSVRKRQKDLSRGLGERLHWRMHPCTREGDGTREGDALSSPGTNPFAWTLPDLALCISPRGCSSVSFLTPFTELVTVGKSPDFCHDSKYLIEPEEGSWGPQIHSRLVRSTGAH